MSQFCPLCGKTKPEEALFCDDCTRKIHNEYEVDIPKEVGDKKIPAAGDIPVKDWPSVKFVDARLGGKPQKSNVKTGLGVEEADEFEPETETWAPKKTSKMVVPLLFFLVIALLTGAFFIYNSTIRKPNLDRSGWNAAVRSNTVAGYLTYMEAYPHGAYFDEAQAGLLRLKSEEISEWERMKKTNNVAELLGFLERNTGTPYASLAKIRLDSLLWIGALQMNTQEAYSDYMKQAENGSIGGDYIAEAQQRYQQLSMPQPNDTIVTDSISETQSYP
ncbi:hypothetical protein SDC9_88263 [bioreactor metagenome]|uniref:Zinc-ribbon domain-containing protein n=1 Tax=bioreactor metagenome TaxID=1076179 RepID=A0A644ZML6_9ZZZZ|nr:hypothetical protein [Proteiniphilum sp.]MEA4916116.1 hypothetical protein [Proteiniphilum sp.]